MVGVTDAGKHWTLDRRVPVGIIVTFVAAIMVQTAILSSYIGALDNRVAQLEKHQEQRADERDRLVTLETQTRSVYDTLLRIERRMERDDMAARRFREQDEP